MTKAWPKPIPRWPFVSESYDYDWKTAEKEFRRAIQLNPDYATAHQWYAEFLSWQGRFDEALAEIERSRHLDPLSLVIATDQGVILYYSRQYDRAIARCQAVVDMDPAAPRAATFAFYTYVQQRKFSEAAQLLARLQPRFENPWNYALRAQFYGRSGRNAEAQAEVAKLEASKGLLKFDRTLALLAAYSGIGAKDQTIALLEESYSQRSHAVVALKADPTYDFVHTDPRFQNLLHRLALD